MLLDSEADRPWRTDEPRINKLVFIGRNLDRAELDEAVNEDRGVRAVQVLRPELRAVPPRVPAIPNADQLALALGAQRSMAARREGHRRRGSGAPGALGLPPARQS